MELQTTTTALFTGQLVPSKDNAVNLGKAIADDCRTGFAETLPTVAKLKAIMLACETALEELDQDIISEVSKYGKDGTSVLSCIRIEPIEACTKYNYAASGDPKWKALKGQVEEAAKALKDRETFLKALKQPLAETDMETGEVNQLIPPPKSSKSTYKVTFIASPAEGVTLISQG
jgi:hypothetical protein